MLDYIENWLRSIGAFFNFFGDSIGQFLNWFSSSYPLTFKLIVSIFCVLVAIAPFVFASIATFRENK